jgi:photosystem II stability/assembly factor-like uncharacterized protein
MAINPFNPEIILASAQLPGGVTDQLFLSENGGENWRSVYSIDTINLLSFDPKRPYIVYAGANDRLLKSLDRGRTWKESQPVKVNDKSIGFRNLRVMDNEKNVIYALSNGLMKSHDSGESWRKIGNKCISFAVAPSSPNIIYSNCFIYSGSSIDRTITSKSTDYGETWESASIGLPSAWFAPTMAVDPKNPNVAFASWANGGLYRTINGGKTWEESDNGLIDENYHEFIRGYLLQPALHKAVINQDIKLVRKLLKQKEDVNEITDVTHPIVKVNYKDEYRTIRNS